MLLAESLQKHPQALWVTFTVERQDDLCILSRVAPDRSHGDDRSDGHGRCELVDIWFIRFYTGMVCELRPVASQDDIISKISTSPHMRSAIDGWARLAARIIFGGSTKAGGTCDHTQWLVITTVI